MKTNDYLLVSATAAYSFLFYQQNAGINFLLFSVFLVAVLLYRDRSLFSKPKWLWAAGLVMISSAFVVVHSSALSIVATICSLLLLCAFSFNVETSALFSFLFSVYSVLSVPVFMIIDAVNRKASDAADTNKGYRWAGFGIVSCTSILFFVLYKNSNPLFAENTKWINFDFLSIAWTVFTGGGFFLMYGFIHHRTIKPVEQWENNLSSGLEHKTEEDPNPQKTRTETISIITLFSLLNIMLLIINAGDIQTLLLGGELPKGLRHSDFVHNGVGTLIFSIVLAISIIMYFLRGRLNFVKGNSYFKFLILLWIFQNIVMLISTCYRNHLYIYAYTLTYKRIGVYVWLCLAIAGLCITAIKVRFGKSNWYLVKTNVAVWFTVLALSPCTDWDLLITRYNLAHKDLKDVDYYYLFSLSDTNIPEMIRFCEKKLKQETTAPVTYNDRSWHYSCYPYVNLLHYKVESYLLDYKAGWQSYDLRDRRILKSIYNQ
ncbi:MAG: DUF4153 domain-containing protein [Bacteroidia bacterium]